MSSGISNRSRWLPRFIPNVPPVLALSSLNQRSEHSARRDHGPPENGRYAAPGMHRSPDPPQPRTSYDRCTGACATVRSSRRDARHRRAPRPRSPRRRSTPGRGPRTPRNISSPVLEVLPQRETRSISRLTNGSSSPYSRPFAGAVSNTGQRPSVVGVDLTPTIVVEKRHRLPRLLPASRLVYSASGSEGSTTLCVPTPAGNSSSKRRVNGHPGARQPLLRALSFGV